MAGLIKVSSHYIKCFVLLGYQNDKIERAEKRLNDVLKLDIMPMAMLWRDKNGGYDLTWRRFQREWASSVIVGSKMKELKTGVKENEKINHINCGHAGKSGMGTDR